MSPARSPSGHREDRREPEEAAATAGRDTEEESKGRVERSNQDSQEWVRKMPNDIVRTISLAPHPRQEAEAMAGTFPSVQSSVPCSSYASYKPQPSLGAFPRQVVQVLQESYGHGTHYPSQILKLRLAIKTMRHTLAPFLILD